MDQFYAYVDATEEEGLPDDFTGFAHLACVNEQIVSFPVTIATAAAVRQEATIEQEENPSNPEGLIFCSLCEAEIVDAAGNEWHEEV